MDTLIRALVLAIVVALFALLASTVYVCDSQGGVFGVRSAKLVCAGAVQAAK